MELVINAANGSFTFHLPDSHTVKFKEMGKGIAIVVHIGSNKVVELVLQEGIQRARVTNSHNRTEIDWPLELPERVQSDLTALAPA